MLGMEERETVLSETSGIKCRAPRCGFVAPLGTVTCPKWGMSLRPGDLLGCFCR